MPAHPSSRSQTSSQKTIDALIPLVGEAEAALLCMMRSSPVESIKKQEIMAAYKMLFDAVRPILEEHHLGLNAGKPTACSTGRIHQPVCEHGFAKVPRPNSDQKPCPICTQQYGV